MGDGISNGNGLSERQLLGGVLWVVYVTAILLGKASVPTPPGTIWATVLDSVRGASEMGTPVGFAVMLAVPVMLTLARGFQSVGYDVEVREEDQRLWALVGLGLFFGGVPAYLEPGTATAYLAMLLLLAIGWWVIDRLYGGKAQQATLDQFDSSGSMSDDDESDGGGQEGWYDRREPGVDNSEDTDEHREVLTDATVLGVVAAVGWMTWIGGPATVPFLVGAVVTFIVAIVTGSRQRFATSGSLYTLLLGAMILGLERISWGVGVTGTPLPESYYQSLFVSCILFGTVGTAVVVARGMGRLGVRRFGERVGISEEATAVWEFLSAVAGALTVAWTVIKAKAKLTKDGAVAGGGAAGVVFNVVGVELPIPFWLLSDGVDATILVVVGATVVGFHSLSSWMAALRLAKESPGTSVLRWYIKQYRRLLRWLRG